MKYKQVTADEWADFCSSFRAYATESVEGKDDHPVMYHKLAQGPMVGEIIGVVHYHHAGNKTYEIADMPNEEKIEMSYDTLWTHSYKGGLISGKRDTTTGAEIISYQLPGEQQWREAKSYLAAQQRISRFGVRA